MPINLMQALLDEIERNGKLLERYESIGAPGQFAKILIKKDVDDAKATIANGDVGRMIHCYQMLKRNE